MTEDIEEKPLESSTSEGDNQSTPPVDNVADEVSREPSDTGTSARKPTKRELLVKELSQPSPKDEVDEEEDEDAEEPEASVAKEPEGQVPEDKPEAAGDTSKHDTSDRRSKAREAFEKLTTHNRELKTKLDEAQPFAEYGKSMFKYCQDAGISTEKLGLWLTVAADAEKNPAGARSHLEKLGIRVEPVREVVPQIPEGLEDTLLDMAMTGRLEPEAFKTVQALLRKAKATAAAPVPSTPPVQTPPVSQPPVSSAAPNAIDPRKAVYDRNLAKAIADINEREDELASKYPADWPKMKEAIAKGFSRYRGTDPTLWKGFFEDELNKVIAKAKRPSTPPSQSTQIRPSSTNTSANKAPPSKLAALKADIVAGKVR